MPYVINDRVRIHSEVEGEGPPLFLHHGITDSWEGWYEFGDAQQARGKLQLIMIDGRGHGDSDKPHDAQAYAMEAMVSDVVAVLDTIGIYRTHYYGNSYP